MTGATGATGAAGAEGRAGSTGAEGAPGPAGLRGPSGTVVLPTGLAIKIAAIMVATILAVSAGLTLWISDHNTSRVEHNLCVRAREFTPAIAVYFSKHHVFAPKVERRYLATIPTECP